MRRGAAAAAFVVLPLLAVALLDLLLDARQPEASTRERALKVRPSRDRIYLLAIRSSRPASTWRASRASSRANARADARADSTRPSESISKPTRGTTPASGIW
jgi:hypothetical protein